MPSGANVWKMSLRSCRPTNIIMNQSVVVLIIILLKLESRVCHVDRLLARLTGAFVAGGESISVGVSGCSVHAIATPVVRTGGMAGPEELQVQCPPCGSNNFKNY